MADTIAVMNHGVIEQMGPPTEIYERPRTAFVANFLGQSNLLPGKVTARDDSTITITSQGQAFRVPVASSASGSSSLVLGVRPEKLEVRHLANVAAVPDGHNRINGVVTDASFVGVSTQYLVRTPWEQELVVFEQNLEVGERVTNGDDVVVHWDPANAFALDGDEDLTAGIEPEVLELEAPGLPVVG